MDNRLREARANKEWTVRRLADESGVDKNTVSQIERGKRDPMPVTKVKLARALGMEVPDLFPREKHLDPSAAEREMEMVLREARQNMALLRIYLEDPPDEEAADEAMWLFYELMPRPMELLNTMDPETAYRYINEVTELLPEQLNIRDQLGPWNREHYAHLHEDSA